MPFACAADSRSAQSRASGPKSSTSPNWPAPAICDADQPDLTRELVLIEEHVAQQTSRPQPSLLVQHGPQEFICAEMTFQQEIHVAIARHVYRDGCEIIRADKLCPGDQARQPERLRLSADFPFVANPVSYTHL